MHLAVLGATLGGVVMGVRPPPDDLGAEVLGAKGWTDFQGRRSDSVVPTGANRAPRTLEGVMNKAATPAKRGRAAGPYREPFRRQRRPNNWKGTTMMKLPSLASVLIATLVASACGSSTHASSASACATLFVGYSPTRVHPGQVFNMDLRVQNCSSAQESIAVKIHADGPCAFPHAVSHTYILGANQGADQAATIVAPDCPGQYTLVARAYVNGSLTATHRASFTVEKPQKVTLQPGRYQFQLGNQVYVGDKIACVTASGASAGGGVIPTPGHGVSSSTGFNLQVTADGTVHITCPAQPGTM